MNEYLGKPEKIFVPEIGNVGEGEVVKVPKHKIVMVLGSELEEWCESTTGKVNFLGGMPNYVAEVECSNANTLGVKHQCVKRWRSE